MVLANTVVMIAAAASDRLMSMMGYTSLFMEGLLGLAHKIVPIRHKCKFWAPFLPELGVNSGGG
jgi:hypothetical protein